MKSILLSLIKLPKLKVNRFKFILIFSIIFIYLGNSFYFVNRFHINKHTGSFTTFSNIISLLAESLLALLIMIILLWLISIINKFLLKIICAILLVITGAFFYYIMKANLIVDSLLISAIVEPDLGEGSQIINMWAVLCTIFLGVIPALFILFRLKIVDIDNNKIFNFKFFYYWLISSLKFVIIPVAIIIIMICILNKSLIFPVSNIKKGLYIYMPFNYIAGGFSYSKSFIARKFANNDLIDISKEDPFIFNNQLSNKKLTIVLVVGESARAQNQHYNGYPRDTNAYTESIPNVNYFKDMQSCGTFTIYSVPCMLNPLPKSKFSLPPKYDSFVSILSNLGFRTWWISSQTSFVASRDKNRILGNLVNAAETQYFASDLYQSNASNYNNYDDALLRFLDQALKNKAQHKFIVLHIRGSHFFYKLRYPEKFNKFQAICNKKDSSARCQAKITEAQYDNSLLYTDWLLSQVIQKLKDKNSILFYASDHGESLAVDKSGFLLHGAPYDQAPYTQKHVAAFMWFSDSMIKLIPNSYKNVSLYKNRHISHDYIYNSLFDCLGIKSKAVDSKLSLCRKP
ncbi:phosphoethanolamine transferase [Rickettsiales bacterium LUAb2]